LNADWRNLLAAFETALRLLHPAMPFLTEELWQRLAGGHKDRPKSIALAGYPRYRAELTDFEAEREVGVVQELVTMARTLRAESKLDPKQQLKGVVYSRNAALDIARQQVATIERLANVKLEFSGEAPAKSPVMRSTAQFDLVLEAPASQLEAQRKRLEKEREQLVKNIANSKRQLGDEKFLGRAPQAVIESIRKKLADYEEQVRKIDGAV
jgi:valyl-tRNA synthetase